MIEDSGWTKDQLVNRNDACTWCIRDLRIVSYRNFFSREKESHGMKRRTLVPENHHSQKQLLLDAWYLMAPWSSECQDQIQNVAWVCQTKRKGCQLMSTNTWQVNERLTAMKFSHSLAQSASLVRICKRWEEEGASIRTVKCLWYQPDPNNRGTHLAWCLMLDSWTDPREDVRSLYWRKTMGQ